MHDGRWGGIEGSPAAHRHVGSRRVSTSAAEVPPPSPPPSPLAQPAPALRAAAERPHRRRPSPPPLTQGGVGRAVALAGRPRGPSGSTSTRAVAPASRIACSNVRAGWAGATSHDPVGTSPEQATHSETTRRARPELRRPSSHITWARVVGGCRGKAVRKPEDPSGVQGGGRARTHLRAAGRSRSSAWLSPCRHRLESTWNLWLGARPA